MSNIPSMIHGSQLVEMICHYIHIAKWCQLCITAVTGKLIFVGVYMNYYNKNQHMEPILHVLLLQAWTSSCKKVLCFKIKVMDMNKTIYDENEKWSQITGLGTRCNLWLHASQCHRGMFLIKLLCTVNKSYNKFNKAAYTCIYSVQWSIVNIFNITSPVRFYHINY